MTENNRMKEMPVNRLMMRMGLPMILSMALQAVYNIVDSAFVGNMREGGEAALNRRSGSLLLLAHAVRVLDLGLERDADEVLRLELHKRFLDDLHVYFSSLRRTKRCGFASGLSFGFLLSYSAYALTMRCTSS